MCIKLYLNMLNNKNKKNLENRNELVNNPIIIFFFFIIFLLFFVDSVLIRSLRDSINYWITYYVA